MRLRRLINKLTANPWFKKYLGLLFCVLDTACTVTTVALVRELSLPPAEKLFARSCVQLMIMLPYVTHGQIRKRSQLRVPAKVAGLMILRGMLGAGVNLCVYNAIDRLSIGNVTAIKFCSTIVAGVVARLFLGDAYTVADGLLGVLAISGVTFISQPEFMFEGSAVNPVGVLLACSAALMHGVVMVVIRSLKATDPVVGLFYSVSCGLLTNAAVLAVQGSFTAPQTYGDVWKLLGLGLLGVLGPFCVAKAMVYERPSTVCTMSAVDITAVYVVQVSRYL